jgi:hypothetical protein
MRDDLSQGGGNVRTWLWESSKSGERLAVTVLKAMGELPAGFRDYHAGSRAGLIKDGATVEEEHVAVDTEPYVSVLNGRLKNGNAYSNRCIGTGRTGAMPWTICAVTVSFDHEQLRPLRESLRAGECPEG